MIKNLLLVVIFSLLASTAFGADKNYDLLAAQITELKNRIGVLEQEVSSLTKAKGKEAIKPTTSESAIPSDKVAGDNPRADYDNALALLKNGKFEEAEEKFADFLVKYPGHQLRENAVFWHAESFYRQDDWNQAAIQYLKAYQEYPKGAKAADSLLKLSLSLGALDKVKEACNILDKLDKEFPTRPASSVSRSSEAKKKFDCKVNAK